MNKNLKFMIINFIICFILTTIFIARRTNKINKLERINNDLLLNVELLQNECIKLGGTIPQWRYYKDIEWYIDTEIKSQKELYSLFEQIVAKGNMKGITDEASK